MASVAVVAACCAAAAAFAGDGPRREAVRERAEREAATPAPDWQRRIERSLAETRVTFEFEGTPLSEVLDFLAERGKITIVLDPFVMDRGGEPWMSLKVTDMELGSALAWVLRHARLGVAFLHGGLLVTTPDNLRGEVELRVYEVRDLARVPQDRPSPEIDLGGRVWPSGPRRPGDYDADGALRLSAAGLPDFVMARARPQDWGAELGTSVETREGHLLVVQRPEVHEEIADLLRRLREGRSLQVRVEARIIDLPERLLYDTLRPRWIGEGVVYLRSAALDVLDESLRPGGEGKLVAACSVTCFSGQRSHALEGAVRELAGPDGGATGLEFRGTVLDVRPTVSFDRTFVMLDLRLRRFEDVDRPGSGTMARRVRTWRFDTSVQCLDTDTVLVCGTSPPERAMGLPRRRLVALVTPTVLRLDPPPRPRAARPASSQGPEAPASAPPAEKPAEGASED